MNEPVQQYSDIIEQLQARLQALTDAMRYFQMI